MILNDFDEFEWILMIFIDFQWISILVPFLKIMFHDVFWTLMRLFSASPGPPAHSLTVVGSQGAPLPRTGGGQKGGNVPRFLPFFRISTGGVFRTPEIGTPKK